MVHFTDVRNIASITMKVWRLNVKGDFEEDVEEERVYKKAKTNHESRANGHTYVQICG